MLSLEFSTAWAAKDVDEHAAFHLITVKHPGQQLRDFRGAESKDVPLSSFSSAFQPVCVIVQLWMPRSCWVYTRPPS